MIPHKVKLTGELAAIAEVIGFGMALRLASDFGGTVVIIPKNPQPGQRIVDCIGMAATQKMIKAFGPGKIEIPIGPAGTYNKFIRTQAQHIDAEIKAGKNNVKIARKVGCTVRTVRAHRNGKSKKGQPGLFD